MTRQPRQAIKLELSPCDNCRCAKLCRTHYLACDAYVLFSAGGSVERWQRAPRLPAASKYQLAAA